MIVLISSLLPVIVTLGLGFFAGWHRDFSQDQSSVLNRMVMLYALPLLLASGILRTHRKTLLSNMPVLLWLGLGMIAGYLLSFVLFKFIFKDTSAVAGLRAITVAGPAIPFVGPSVLGSIFGVESDVAIAIGSILLNLVQLPITILFLTSLTNTNQMEKKKTKRKLIETNLLNSLKEPVIWVPLLSFLLVLVGFNLPKEFDRTFTLLGNATGGVALFASGAILYAQKIAISKDVIMNVCVKNIIIPSVLWGVMLFCGISSHLTHLTVLTIALPTASISIMLAVQYKIYEKEAASSLFFSTLFSMITLGILILFMI